MALPLPSFLFFLLQLTLLLFYSFSSFHLLAAAAPATVSISETGNQTIVCAINQQSLLKCTSLSPQGTIQIPGCSQNSSPYTMTVSGDGFVCATTAPSSSMVCWRFSANSSTNITFKRIYHGDALHQLAAGNTHIAGTVKGTNALRWWQWAGFDPAGTLSFSSVAVGQEFVCGLNSTGNIRCLGSDADLTAQTPRTGNYSVIAAGFRHACAISSTGTLDCWGDMAGAKPDGGFMDLALGNNRSCALRLNQTVVCWGTGGFGLPASLQQTYFVAIAAKSSVFCGIVSSNYSLLCWGNEALDANPLVFASVLPGACTNQCPCAPLPNSSIMCGQGRLVCRPCITHTTSGSSFNGHRWSAKTVAFLVAGIVVFICLVILGACLFLYRRGKGGSRRVHDSERLDEQEYTASLDGRGAQPGGSRSLGNRLSRILSMDGASKLEEFPLETLLQVTDNFSRDHKVGSGSFGSVYRATLEDGREVAIKRAESSSFVLANPIGLAKRQEQNDTAFLAELELLSRLNHKNLVRLLGFCEDGPEQILVYEYMSNSTIHEHLHKLKSSSPLASWPRRIQVALDAARGIQYLHEFSIPPIIHRDIKSSNILLDDNWTAKVSDFGLSLTGPKDEESHLLLQAAGTVGYMDPNYYRLHQLTTKSDVYSFGVVLLELLCGQKAIHLNEQGIPRNVVDFAVPYILRDDIQRILDSNVSPPTPVEIEALTYTGYLAVDCVSLESSNRPPMTEIVNCLERALKACMTPPTLHWASTTSDLAIPPTHL